MSTLTPNYPMREKRKSTETDQRQLLSESVAPSESASMVEYYNEDSGDRTPRARSPNRASSLRSTATTTTPTSYRGFASEAEYLAAFEEWAESKKYLEPETRLIGFYGHRTMEEIASQPRPEIGLTKKWKARRERKEKKAAKGEERRNTVA